MEKVKNKELAELLGIMIGDGCLSRSGGKYLIYISGHKIDDLKYHQSITKHLFKKVFNKIVDIKFKSKEETLFIRFSDKSIFQKFKSFGIPVGKKYLDLNIPTLVKEEKLFVHFLRGLFDTDGCIVLSKQHREIPYYPRIEITSKTEIFLIRILKRLRKFNFYGSVSNKGGGYRLEIPGFKNLDLWLNIVGSSNPKHKKKFMYIKNNKRFIN